MTNESGSVTDTLVFDAFGNETAKTGSTDNSYGFQGEEKDETGLYYLRARYMDPSTGTFTSMDTYGGSLTDPMSLHKYLFANSNPVAYCDPSGHFSLMEMDATMTIDSILNAGYISGYLYIIDASITDPNLEHHDFMGYLGVIGAGMLFATMSLVLSATVTGLLILAIIDTLLGAVGTRKGIIDIINGHPIYGGAEIIASVVLVWTGWRNYAGARSASKAASSVENTEKKQKTVSSKVDTENNKSPEVNHPPKKRGPKPKGTGRHNLKIEEVAKQIKDGKIIAGGGRGYPPEAKIPTPNGIKESRRPDILVERFDDGSIYGINVGKTTASGAPIKREAEAINDLEQAGIPMWYIPYDM